MGLLTPSIWQISSTTSLTTVEDVVFMIRSVPPGSRYICLFELRPAEMAAISSILGTFLRPPYLNVFFRFFRQTSAVAWNVLLLSYAAVSKYLNKYGLNNSEQSKYEAIIEKRRHPLWQLSLKDNIYIKSFIWFDGKSNTIWHFCCLSSVSWADSRLHLLFADICDNSVEMIKKFKLNSHDIQSDNKPKEYYKHNWLQSDS